MSNRDLRIAAILEYGCPKGVGAKSENEIWENLLSAAKKRLISAKAIGSRSTLTNDIGYLKWTYTFDQMRYGATLSVVKRGPNNENNNRWFQETYDPDGDFFAPGDSRKAASTNGIRSTARTLQHVCAILATQLQLEADKYNTAMNLYYKNLTQTCIFTAGQVNNFLGTLPTPTKKKPFIDDLDFEDAV